MNLLDFKNEFHMQIVQDGRDGLEKHVIIIRQERIDTDSDFTVVQSYDLTLDDIIAIKQGLEAMHRRMETYIKDCYRLGLE